MWGEQADDGTDCLEDGMRSVSVRTPRRALVSVAVTVAALGWGPAQAVAAGGPLDPLLGGVAETTSGAADLVDPLQGTVDTVSSTTDTLSDPLPDPVDEVVDTTTDTVEGVSGSASGIVNPVSDATSGTVDAVAGSTTDVASGVTDAVGTPYSGLSDPTLPAGASSAGSSVSDRTGSASSTRAMEFGPSGGAALLEAREGADPAAEVGSRQGAQDSLTGAVADILRKLLAFTGWGALSWIAVLLGLSIVGVAAVYHGRRRPRLSGSASRS